MRTAMVMGMEAVQVAAAIDLAGGEGGVGSGEGGEGGGGGRALTVREGRGRGAGGEEAGGRLLRGFGAGAGDAVGEGGGRIVTGMFKIVEGLLAVGKYEEAADVVLRGLDDKVSRFVFWTTHIFLFVG